MFHCLDSCFSSNGPLSNEHLELVSETIFENSENILNICSLLSFNTVKVDSRIKNMPTFYLLINFNLIFKFI